MVEPISILKLDSAIVGRTREPVRPSSALTKVREGQGQAIFVSGEAGIGKTRLCEEFLKKADDCPVLRGGCLPEALEPLVPIRKALRSGDLEKSFTGIVCPDCSRSFWWTQTVR